MKMTAIGTIRHPAGKHGLVHRFESKKYDMEKESLNAEECLKNDNPTLVKHLENGWEFVKKPTWTEHFLEKNEKGEWVFPNGLGNVMRPAHS